MCIYDLFLHIYFNNYVCYNIKYIFVLYSYAYILFCISILVIEVKVTYIY